MVIKSPFKDYYDHVANRWGGGDPSIVYARTKLPTMVEITGNIPLRSPMGLNIHSWSPKPVDKVYAYIVVAGKLYLVAKPVTDLKDNINHYRLAPDPELENRKKSWWNRGNDNIEYGKEHPFLIKLSQVVGHPVFAIRRINRIDNKTDIYIDNLCPQLRDIGFPTIISPEQMYQDLSYFLGNLMKVVPDTQPPIELSNKQKIIKAGFDLVTSFRHRK